MDPSAFARLALLAAILAVSGPVPATTPSATGGETYVVQAGDTLYSIALKFNTTIQLLQEFNGLTNPNSLSVGQELRIPGANSTAAATTVPATTTARGPTPTTAAPAAQTFTNYTVKPGDTLATIAAQFGVNVQELAQLNSIADINILSVGQTLRIPKAATGAAPVPDGFALNPSIVRQGNTIQLQITAADVVSATGKFDQQPLHFNSADNTLTALIGISRCANYVGSYPVTLTLYDAQGQARPQTFNLRVNAGNFGLQDLTLTPQMSALLDPAIIQAEDAQVARTVAPYTPQQSWTDAFRLPLAVKSPRISTSFGDRRSYNGGKPGLCGHEGTDYAVAAGTPVYAPAAGTVVLAAPLKVRGNVVFVDHGHGVYSGFYHLSEIIAKNGQHVDAGDLLGKVGSTGFSTGADLHWSMWLNGVYVDPSQWMQETIP